MAESATANVTVATIGGSASQAPVAGSGSSTYSGVQGDQGGYYLGGYWLSPIPLDFGNIIGEKVITVNVLCTIRDAGTTTLPTIDTSFTQGLTSVGLPLNFDFLQVSSVDIVASAVGPNQFTGNTIFNFSAGDIAVLTFGRRLVLLDAEPEVPVSEKLLYSTSIKRKRSSKEQRISLRRGFARLEQTYRYSLDNKTEFSRIRSLLLGFQGFLWGIPQYAYARKLTSAALSTDTILSVNTTDLDFRAGGTLALKIPGDPIVINAQILSTTSSTITIEDPIGVDLPRNTSVMPIRFGYLTGPISGNVHANNLTELQLTFETTDLADFAEDPATIGGFDFHESEVIFNDPNAILTGNRISFNQTIEVENFDSSATSRTQFAKFDRATPMIPKGVAFKNYAELNRWRKLFDWLKGSYGQFYVPTFQDDLQLVGDLEMDSGSVQIVNQGISSVLGGAGAYPYADLYIEFKDGRSFSRRITSVQNNGPVEDILFSALGPAETIPNADVRVGWLMLARVAGDSVSIRHLGGGRGTISFLIEGLSAL